MHRADLAHPDPALSEQLAHLHALRHSLSGITRAIRPEYMGLLHKLGNPHLHLPPVIHVAGTNGKGSTIAFLRAILEAGGYRVHAYTSPHLVRFNERVVLAGQIISDVALAALIDEGLEANDGARMTFFEITTALAFLAFSRVSADVLLLEVGMGGRLDSTNVVPYPALCLITRIGHDHHLYLGDTLACIAREKAGIMKPKTPCVTNVLAPESIQDAVDDIYAQQANKTGCPLFRYGPDWNIDTNETNPDSFILNIKGRSIKLPIPVLPGAHQIENAALAIAGLEVIKDRLPCRLEHYKAGLRTARWPARLQNISRDLNAPAGWDLWLDGAHNEDGARIVAQQAQHWARQDNRPLHLIVGMKNDKDAAAFLAPISPQVASITWVPVESLGGENHAPAALRTAANWQQALEQIVQENPAPGRILICGSLYLAGDVLRACAANSSA